jgi:hypothetical protein
MSTKIYEAYRLPIKNLNKFLERAKNHSINKVSERVQMLMDNMKPEGFYKVLLKKYKEEKYIKEHFNDGSPSRYTQFDVVMDCCKEAAAGSRRDPIFDIECGWTARLYDDDAFLIPYGEGYLRKGFRKPKLTKDFSYWNNTDKPTNVSNAEWDRRYKTWNKLFKLPVMMFHIVDLKFDSVNSVVDIMQKMKVGLFADTQNGTGSSKA